jgi:hypothetical protein
MVAVSYSLVSAAALVASSLVGQAAAMPIQPMSASASTSERAYPGGGPRMLRGRLVDYKVRLSRRVSL